MRVLLAAVVVAAAQCPRACRRCDRRWSDGGAPGPRLGRADRCALQTYLDADPTEPERLLLRFNGYVHNQGTGALEIVGRAPGRTER